MKAILLSTGFPIDTEAVGRVSHDQVVEQMDTNDIVGHSWQRCHRGHRGHRCCQRSWPRGSNPHLTNLRLCRLG